jgi:hypothetical protein
VLGAIRGGGACFSVTAPMNSKIRAAITSIPESAWTPIIYPRAIWDEDQHRLISDAQVAEMPYTAFASKKKGQPITARLIVRRVRDLNRQTAEGQDELFPIWRYHAVFTDWPFEMIQAEGQHRDHAVAEQVFADLSDGPLAHLPSGHFPANAAWLTVAAICHNLTRAAGDAGGTVPRQSPRRDHPPAPDQRRCPHRPPRPRPHHRAPARGLAPRPRMDEPVRSRLRAASRRGLTSPDPVTAPRRPLGHPASTCPSPRTGQAAEQASGRKATPGNSDKTTASWPPRQIERQNSCGGSRLSARLSNCRHLVGGAPFVASVP